MKALANLAKWQNYVHYLLLAGGVFLIHKSTELLGLEQAVVTGGTGAWIILFLFYAGGLLVADTIIHAFFYLLPEPLQWRDD